MLRALAGLLVVAALKLLGSFPPNLIVAIGTPFLLLYIPIKRNVRRRFREINSLVPFDMPSSLTYYRMRLRLTALSLRHLMGHEHDVSIQVEGEECYASALATGKPVVLLGWHQGPVELLHRLPPLASDDKAFYIFTGKGFSPIFTRLLHKGRKQNGKQSVEPKDQAAALRSWSRRRGLIAVMMDQVPGKPREWLSLWNGAVEIPIPQNLLEWMREREAIFIAVSVRLENDGPVLFRYELVGPDLKGLKSLIET